MKIAGEKNTYCQKWSSSPTYLMIEPTNRCNLKCKTCSREELHDIGDMNIELFKQVLSELPNVKTIKFHGLGETYLAKDVMQMLELCKDRNIDVVSISNCLWNHIDIPYLMTLLKHMYISYHAAEEKTYKEICGGGNWKLLHDNIRAIVANKGNCEVVFNCVISSLNYLQLNGIVKNMYELGVDSLRLQIMQNWTIEGEELHDDLAKVAQLDEDILVEKLKDAYAVADELGVSIDLVGNTEFDFTHCIWPFERTYINKNGDVIPCSMRPAPEYKVGNITTSSFDEIWSGNTMKDIRNLLSNNHAPKMCEGCPYIESAEVLKRVKKKLAR